MADTRVPRVAEVEAHGGHRQREQVAVKEPVDTDQLLVATATPYPARSHRGTRGDWAQAETHEAPERRVDHQRRERQEADRTGRRAEQRVAERGHPRVRLTPERFGDAAQAQLDKNLKEELQDQLAEQLEQDL